MAVTKLDPELIDRANLYWGDLEHDATTLVKRPDGTVVEVTLGRLQEVFNAGVPGSEPTIEIIDGGEMENDTVDVIDGGEMEDDLSVVFDGGEVIP